MTTTAGALRGWVVSVDLWGTLITYGDREAEAAWRLREFQTVVRAFGYALTPEQVKAAVLPVREETLQRQRTTGEQIRARDQVTAMVTRMGIIDEALVDVLVVPHTHAVLRACPDVIPGAHQTLRQVKATGARLVLTSNTLATPAEVTRRILDGHDLGELFDDMVFSSEVGAAKPHPEVFQAVAERSHTPLERVIHVGNDWRTDVLGALSAGCRAIWFNPKGKPPRPIVPDIAHLADLSASLTRLSTTNPPAAPIRPRSAATPRSIQ